MRITPTPTPHQFSLISNKHFNCEVKLHKLLPPAQPLPKEVRAWSPSLSTLWLKYWKTKSRRAFRSEHQFNVDLNSEFFSPSPYVESNTLFKSSSFFCIKMTLIHHARWMPLAPIYEASAAGVTTPKVPAASGPFTFYWNDDHIQSYRQRVITNVSLPVWAYFPSNSNLPL